MLTIFDLIAVDPLLGVLTFVILICGAFKAELKLFWINDDEDCFGGSGDKGKISVGNYW